jgi:hypothetical protein
MVLSFRHLQNIGKPNCCRHSNNARKIRKVGQVRKIFLTADYLINFAISRQVMSLMVFS